MFMHLLYTTYLGTPYFSLAGALVLVSDRRPQLFPTYLGSYLLYVAGNNCYLPTLPHTSPISRRPGQDRT